MIYKLLPVILFFTFSLNVNAQSLSQTMANNMARKMKDSLNLSEAQRALIFSANIRLHNEKMRMRQLYTGTDSLRKKIQGVENTRDSLYRPILNDREFKAYKAKKKDLNNNN